MAVQTINVCDVCGKEISCLDESFCNSCKEWMHEMGQRILGLSDDITDVDFKSGGVNALDMHLHLTFHAPKEDVLQKVSQQLYGEQAPYGITGINIIVHQQSQISWGKEGTYDDQG